RDPDERDRRADRIQDQERRLQEEPALPKTRHIEGPAVPVALDTRRLLAIALAVAAVAFAAALLIGKASAGSGGGGSTPTPATPSSTPVKIHGVRLPASI